MENDWKLVYSVNESYQADLCIEILAENSITGVVMDKKDTAVASFGEFEIYVPADSAEIARTLLQKSEI